MEGSKCMIQIEVEKPALATCPPTTQIDQRLAIVFENWYFTLDLGPQANS